MIAQRSDEWFAKRAGKATASKFADILKPNLAGYRNYVAQLALERATGEIEETYTSGAMQQGIDLEDVARAEYEARTGHKVELAEFVEHDFLACGASPDGLIGDDGIIEIKCPQKATHLSYLKAGVLPKAYEAQVQGQLWITGRSWANFVSYNPSFPPNAQLLIIPVQRDQDFIANLENAVLAFLDEVEQETEFIKNYGGTNG